MRRSRVLMVGVLSAALMLTACSSDDGEDGAASTTAPAETGDSGDTTGTTVSCGPRDTSGTESSPSTGADLDVCSMVDEETVTAVIGEPGTPTAGDVQAGIHSCTWSREGETVPALSVGILVHDSAEAARASFDMSRESAESEILNLGDAAIYSEAFGLTVLHGVHEITVDNNGDSEKQADLEVAQMIVDHFEA